jgi:putative hydrolase of the HAD superfamily
VKNFVFDLDDTLFKEIDWVKSALRHCADLLSEKCDVDSEKVFRSFWQGFLERGRYNVFHASFEELGIDNAEEWFPYLYYRYRTHLPNDIEISPEVRGVLNKIKENNCHIGIITDGVISAQRNKVEALGLDNLVDAVIYTEVFGYEFRKPNSLPFEVMKKWLGEADEYYYIGDNPDKDFIGAKEAGYITVMLKNGSNGEKLTGLEENYFPDKQINNIEDILEFLNNNT